nr:biotin--[acetyl-CoA-carboxylase] ligase [Desulfobacterales bacterium]
TFATAVALASSLKERGIDSRIKWPNDILIQERKVAGILMEVSADRNRTAIIVVGVGINVNTSIEAFPPSLRDSVTSLSLNIGRPLSRIRVFQDFLTHFEFWYEVLISERFEDILRAWRGFSSTLGTRVNVTLQEGIISGLAEGIDSQGALLLRDDEGRQHRIIAGDVIHCRPSS